MNALRPLSLSLITIKDSHNRDVMLITNLIEEMKYNAGISFFLSEIESISKRRIWPRIRIHCENIFLFILLTIGDI